MDNSIGYVITATRDTREKLYVAIDYASGGYPYWTAASGAKIYTTYVLANEALTAWEDDNAFMHCASGANFAAPRRTVTIAIEEVQVKVRWSQEYEFSLVVEPGRIDYHIEPVV